MIWLGWLIFLALLTLFFEDQIEKMVNPNKNITSDANGNNSEVVLKRNRNGHYVAGGLINGINVTFIVDTGASDISVPAGLAKELGLEKGSAIRYLTANGSVLGHRTMLNKVQLGGIVINDVRGGINPGMRGRHVLLGMTFLKQLEMIQRGDELTLRSY